jgi:hypothetical protein
MFNSFSSAAEITRAKSTWYFAGSYLRFSACYVVDLPQVDHGGGRARGRERATRATKSRVVDLCPLQEFKSH